MPDTPDHPWHCGLCGQTASGCRCGDPLLMIIRVPDLTADIDDHHLAARGMVDMINAQRHENWVCGGGDPDGVKEVRLVASGWRTPEAQPDLEAAADGWEALEAVAAEQGWDDEDEAGAAPEDDHDA